MNPSRLFILRPVATTLLMVAILLAGVALLLVPRARLPRVRIASAVVGVGGVLGQLPVMKLARVLWTGTFYQWWEMEGHGLGSWANFGLAVRDGAVELVELIGDSAGPLVGAYRQFGDVGERLIEERVFQFVVARGE